MTTHMPRSHPVRELLEAAATGADEPTKKALDDRLIRDDVPEGADLNAHRRAIVTAYRQVADIAKTGDFQNARARADELAVVIGERLSDDERAIAHSIPEDKQEAIGVIGARMYGH